MPVSKLGIYHVFDIAPPLWLLIPQVFLIPSDRRRWRFRRREPSLRGRPDASRSRSSPQPSLPPTRGEPALQITDSSIQAGRSQVHLREVCCTTRRSIFFANVPAVVGVRMSQKQDCLSLKVKRRSERSRQGRSGGRGLCTLSGVRCRAERLVFAKRITQDRYGEFCAVCPVW